MKLRAKIKELEEVSDDELYGEDMEFLKNIEKEHLTIGVSDHNMSGMQI